MLRASVRPSQEGLSYSTYHVFTPGRDSNVAFMYNDSYGAVAIDYATQNPDDEDYIKDGILGGSLEVVQGDAPRSSRKRTIEEVDDAEQDETARALFIEDEHMEEELVDADPEAPGDGDEDMDLNDMNLSQDVPDDLKDDAEKKGKKLLEKKGKKQRFPTQKTTGVAAKGKLLNKGRGGLKGPATTHEGGFTSHRLDVWKTFLSKAEAFP